MESGFLKRKRTSVKAAGLAFIIVVGGGCGTAAVPFGSTGATPRAEAFWLPYLEGANERTDRDADGLAGEEGLLGRLFTLRIDEPSLSASTWVRCPLEARYRYEASPGSPREVEIRHVQDAARFLPQGYQYFADAIANGGRVKIRYAVAGKFILDGPEPRTAGVICNAATHYVHTIVVGAYRVEVQDKSSGRSSASVQGGEAHGVGVVRIEVEGAVDECEQRAKRSPMPVAGCTAPLAFELRSMTLSRGKAKLRVTDASGLSEIPSSTTMPSVRRMSGTGAGESERSGMGNGTRGVLDKDAGRQ